MEQKDGSKRASSRGSSGYNSSSKRAKGLGNSSGSIHREEKVKEAVASVIVNERSKYESKIKESSKRLDKYTAENDRLLDEVSNLRLQMREMKNDRAELVSAHQESMSLLAQVSEEKLVEFKSKSEQEAIESKAAQEEALRTVLEMMEKDCEDRVAELDNDLARVERDRERAAQLQLEAAAKAAAEEQNKTEMEDTARLAVQKLVEERATRDKEMQNLAEREKKLKHELEMTKKQSEIDKAAAIQRSQQQGSSSSVSTDGSSQQSSYGDSSYTDSRTDSRASSNSRTTGATGSSSGEYTTAECSDMSPLIHHGGMDASHDGSSSATSSSIGAPQAAAAEQAESPSRPPVINHRSMQQYSASPFLNDSLDEMTRGRKMALQLQQHAWYQPRGSYDPQGLGLQSAWAYFEHSILPRYIDKNTDGSITKRNESSNGGNDDDEWLYTSEPKKQKKNKGSSQGNKGDLDRAEPGESNLPTKLYSPIFTPLSQLGDFGIGVGLYFSSLRAVALITLIAGCISMPNILYYASDEYSSRQPGVNFLLKGSAICTEQVWVPCPTCTLDDFDRARSRVAGTVTALPDGGLQTLIFALKNTCDGATFQVGIINMATLGFILLAIAALSLYQRRKQIIFDEQEQTAQDYSIEISNPPGDATEPEEWKEFFESRFGGHLTCCTVTIDNDLLVKALAERREIVFEIEEKIKEGVAFNTLTLAELAAKIEHNRSVIDKVKSRLSPGIPELVGRLTVLNARIQGLAQQQYRATRVFCTFETESAQRKILAKMTVGSMASMRNNTHKLNPNLLFRGEHVLHVREAEEPSTIRWMDLDEKWGTRVKQISVTTLISLVFVVAVAVIVALCRRKGTAYAALAISISNAMFPAIAKAVTNLEAHASETGKQSSLYVKIAIFRWVVTAIVITIITPFTSTLTNGPEHLLQSIYVIFFADLVTTNVLQLADPASNFKRHFLAPRAASQDRMNLLMGGTEYTIAERYTNMTKTLFLTFYYCAIYPSAFFLCALSLFVNFYVDKFSLMRTWKPAPMLGPYIAKFSRIYFMTSAIAALAIVSSYLYSGFPFDNLCAEDRSHAAYYGSWKVTNGEGQDSTAVIEPGMRSYHFCNQFLGPGNNFAFPALPEAQPEGSDWMTDEQEQLTGIYGWVSVGVLGLVGLVFIYRVLRTVQDLFFASYKPNGDVQGQSFSQVETISSYIPQVNSNRFTHPLLAVNIDNIDESIFDWSDHERSHSYYDMTRDAEQLMPKDSVDVCHNAFAQIRHWHPNSDEAEGEKSTKSALRRHKNTNGRRSSVSWSTKVTCKTYSKDDPNSYNFFNANESVSQGMNFRGHAENPLYDPHAQNEARVNDAPPQQQQQQDQPQHTNNNQHFDQYYGTGVDQVNQQPDAMYGDSQQGQDQGGDEYDDGYEYDGGSYATGQSSYAESAGSSYHSDGSSQDSSSAGSSSYNQQQNGNRDYLDEEGSAEEYDGNGSSGSFSSASQSSGGLPPVS